MLAMQDFSEAFALKGKQTVVLFLNQFQGLVIVKICANDFREPLEG